MRNLTLKALPWAVLASPFALFYLAEHLGNFTLVAAIGAGLFVGTAQLHHHLTTTAGGK